MRGRGTIACFALALFALALSLPLVGCARLVVIDPELVASQNSRDWTVRREPGSAAPTESSAAAATPAPAGPPPPVGPARPAKAPSPDDDDD